MLLNLKRKLLPRGFCSANYLHTKAPDTKIKNIEAKIYIKYCELLTLDKAAKQSNLRRYVMASSKSILQRVACSAGKLLRVYSGAEGTV